eukprot:scaffold53366_cov36-Cyclotella_meneghiniana.AAC.3
MSRPSSPSDEKLPGARNSLETLRRSLALMSDRPTTSTTSSPTVTASGVPPASATAGVGLANSRLTGANDGESIVTGLDVSESIVLFPGGVDDDSTWNTISPPGEAVSVGVDPSLYSIDSDYTSVASTAAISSSSVRATPLRTNVSSSLGDRGVFGLQSVAKKRVSVVDVNDSWDDEDSPQDDYSLVSGITASTSATVRGVRGVAQALTSSLFSSLETPKPEKDDSKSSGSLLLKSSYKTPLGGLTRPETPVALDEKEIGQLKISTPRLDSEGTRGIITAEENDPSACRAWLYIESEHRDLCLGTIGKKGLVCVCDRSECKVGSHKKHKTPLVDGTWYLLTKDEAVQISPCLSASVASKSSLWSMYEKQKYNPPNWASIFNHIRSNAAASSPSELITEADSNRLLQSGLVPKGVVPKTPRLLKGTLRDNVDATQEELAKGVKAGFKATEASLADIYEEVTRLSSRVGIPSDPSTSLGSCYGDIEANHLFTTTIESTVNATRDSLKAHRAALIKCDENFTLYGQSIDQAVASSLAAAKAAQDAQHAVHAFGATGTIDKVDKLDRSLGRLEKELAASREEVAGLYGVLRDIIAQIPALKQGSSSPANTAEVESLKSEMEALRRHTLEELKNYKQALDGLGPVSLGSWKFDSAEECAVQLSDWGVTTAIWEHIFDPFHLFGALLHRHRTHKEVGDQAVLSQKTNLTSSKLTAMASFEVTVPEIFTGGGPSQGPGADASKLTSLFAGVKTFELFDGGDGESGVFNYVKINLREILPQAKQEASALFRLTHPGLLSFLDLMRDRAAGAVLDLLKECGELYRNLLTKACGMCTSYTREQKAEAWQQVLILLQVYCQEVSRVRASARNLNNYADPMLANSLAMWASLSALRIHDTFQDNLYREHPRISPKLTGYILTTVLRKGELTPVEDKAQRALTDAQRASAAASRAEAQASSNKSDHDRFVSSFNQWKRTLKVDGAADFPKKAKKRRGNQQGQDADATAEED